jgi:plasmid stabilization system protein ParE
MTEFALHPEASDDLDELVDFIAAHNVNAAHRVVDEIFEAFDRLAQFPHAGHPRPDLTSRPLRFFRVRDYLIAYAPEERPLWIVAVLHGRRHPRVIAALLRGRETE